MDVDTPRGAARVHLDFPATEARGLLVLGHGAGGGVEAADLRAVRDTAIAIGMVVARVEQPYRVAGRRAPAPATHLDSAWTAVVAALRVHDGWGGGLPLLAGGRSSGGRVACRTAADAGASGVLALAFPLHPPGRPERSRAAELAQAGVPVLAINGDRDPFGVPEESGQVTVRVMAGESHALDRDPSAVARGAAGWLQGFLGEKR